MQTGSVRGAPGEHARTEKEAGWAEGLLDQPMRGEKLL